MEGAAAKAFPKHPQEVDSALGSFPVLKEEEHLKWKFDAIFRGGISGLAKARGRHESSQGFLNCLT